jgi:hypothetical protein
MSETATELLSSHDKVERELEAIAKNKIKLLSSNGRLGRLTRKELKAITNDEKENTKISHLKRILAVNNLAIAEWENSEDQWDQWERRQMISENKDIKATISRMLRQEARKEKLRKLKEQHYQWNKRRFKK